MSESMSYKYGISSMWLSICLAVIVVLASGCSYDSALGEVRCTSEGERAGDRICEDGLWKAVLDSGQPDATADADVTPPGDVPAADADAQIDAQIDAETDAQADADACMPLSDAQICQRDGKECGLYTAGNGCGDQVDAQCGPCTNPKECEAGGADPNMCGCPPEEADAFCARLNKDCDDVTADDHCGDEVTHDCGSCPGNEECGAGTDNVCGCPCNIGGECIPSGGINPDNSCEVCDPDTDTQGWTLRSQGATCDDGDACTVNDTCSAGGVCGGQAMDCSHLDGQCHTGICQSGSCVASVQQGATCDDGDFCTQSTVCRADGSCGSGQARTCSPNSDQCLVNVCDSSAGACVPEADVGAACDDGLSCTSNSGCDSSGDCQIGTVDSGSCLIGGQCYGDGDPNPNNPCQLCDAAANPTGWSDQSDGGSCDNGDGLACTGVCNAGSCDNEVQDGHCAIGGTCYSDADANPDNACEACDSSQDDGGWTANTAADGDTCDNGDGLACTGICNAGSCDNGVHADHCAIDNSCYAQRDVNPDNACQVCNSGDDDRNWSPNTSADGDPCDNGDGLACTGICNAGACDDGVHAGHCAIDGACYTDGEDSPNTVCKYCDEANNQEDWTATATGTDCGNGTCSCDGLGACVGAGNCN